MTFSTYADLQSNIATWLARDDLTAYIPDFIRLFECVAARKMGVADAEASTTLTPSSGTIALPTDLLGIKRVTWTGRPRVDLIYAHPSYLEGLYPDTPSDTPRFYTVEAGNLKVRPLSDTSLDVVYWQRTAAVSGTLNWLYTKHPDAYLFGSLCEAEAFNKDAEKAVLWKARRDEAFDEILKSDFNRRGQMQVRTFGMTP